MRYRWQHLLALLLVGTAGLVAFLPGSARAVGEGGDEAEPARRLPARWRDDPDTYRRLKDEWKAFHKLPPRQQARLRQIDEELNDEPPAVRERLWAVLDRYVAWLERLDEKDRQQVDLATDAAKRLEIIKGLREREWLSHLARASRDPIEQAAPDERPALIEKLRQRERQRRLEWQQALRVQAEAPPRVPPDLLQRVRLYEEKSLIPTLTFAERQELFKARFISWPEHARQLTALAEKHTILVPPSERPGVVNFKDLPEGFRQALFPRPGKPKGFDNHPFKELRDAQGRWPNFALAVERAARARKVALPDKPLGPCKPEEFMPAVQRFVNEQLRTDPAAARRLDEAQGKWPDYPFAVMELAKEKKKRVPGTFLPDPPGFWETAKAAPPE
jgi:hypothetical protein